MTKPVKPALYRSNRRGSDGPRVSDGFFKGRVTVSNLLYQRKGRHGESRIPYAKSHINWIYDDAPWFVDCRYPRNFVRIEDALAYAHSPAAYNTAAQDAWWKDHMERKVPYGY